MEVVDVAAVVVREPQRIEAINRSDRIDQDVEILEGLAEGETVATSQMVKLDTGTKVKLAVDAPKNGEEKGA